MRDGKDTSRGDGPLAAVFVAFFCYLGIQTPYFGPWLASRGMGRSDIAAIGAIVMLANTLGQIMLPIMGRRTGVPRMLVLAAGVACLATVALTLLRGFAAIAAAAGVAGLCAGAIIPLSDAEALRRPALRYGRIRALGSIGFAIAAVLAGAMIDRVGANAIPLFQTVALVSVVLAVSAIAVTATPPATPPRNGAGAAFAPLAVPRLWLLIGAVALVNASHAQYYLFANIDWIRHAGLNGMQLGILWAVGVGSEIAVLIVFGARETRVGALRLLLLGALGAAARWVGTAAGPPFFGLLALQLLHGLSFAATLLGGIQFLRLMMPPAARAAALGLFAATVHGIVIGGATLLLGVTGDTPADGYLTMAALALAGGVLVPLLAWATRDGRGMAGGA